VTRVLALIPAHNEAESLAAVVAELRDARSDLDVLIVDDGSTDGTAELLPGLDVRSLRVAERIGVGGAVRAGLRCAAHLQYDIVVRLDGDGQHRAADIARLLTPIEGGRADVVLGSRYLEPPLERGLARAIKRLLAGCLSAVVGETVTDPTSGFYALGRDAIRMLAEHHPPGYPEPELRLLLSRSALRVVEMPVSARPRLTGRSTLTPRLLVSAAARVALALAVFPFKARVEVPQVASASGPNRPAK
jgi:glycosyltransferase involved in cell wall biosynthesis